MGVVFFFTQQQDSIVVARFQDVLGSNLEKPKNDDTKLHTTVWCACNQLQMFFKISHTHPNEKRHPSYQAKWQKRSD
jgi:hypothetical protein